MFLSLGGTPVSVQVDGLDEEQANIGEAGNAYAGQYTSSVRARKRVWNFKTAPLTRSDAATLRGLLDGTTRTATGDFAPDASVQVKGFIDQVEMVRAAGGFRERMNFQLWEV